MKESGPHLAKKLVARELSNADLGRQLHDGVSQVLSAAGLQLELLRMEAGDSPLAARLQEVQHTLETAVSQVRSVSHELNPHTIDRVGLSLTLRNLARQVDPSYKGTYEVISPDRLTLPRQEALSLALCLIESLRAAIHAAGSKRILLRCREGNLPLSFELEWRGGSAHPKLGSCPALMVAREYAVAAGYNYVLETRPEEVTIITVSRNNPET